MIICQSQKTPYGEFHCLVQICYIQLSSCTYSFRKSGLHCMILGNPRYDPKVNSVSDVTDISSWLLVHYWLKHAHEQLHAPVHNFQWQPHFSYYSREIIIIVLHLGSTNVWIMTLGDANIQCSLQITYRQQLYKKKNTICI